jgi:uncharacterized protein YprB with RNaseH-like and TPR domain
MVAPTSRAADDRASNVDAEATRQRLRRLIHRIEANGASEPMAPPVASALAIDEAMPDLELRELPAGRVWVRELCTPLSDAVGEQPLDQLRHAEGDPLTVLARDEEVADASLGELLFLDIETTGLGGAGAIAFLVAIARVEDSWDGPVLQLRQYLAPSPPDEAALLDLLLEDVDAVGADPVLVTYNGRLFDAPFLDGRATMHRMRGGFDALRHVDLLHASRTVYRGALTDCRLATVEAEVMRLARHEDEVAGSQVPAWYFRFLRSGDARALWPIVEHNAVDVISLAALTGRLAAMVRGGVEAVGFEALGLGRLLARAGREAEAQRWYERALEDLTAGPQRDETLLRLAHLHKRAGRRPLAEPLWREVVAHGRSGVLAAWVELAKYYEHERREFARALEATEAALAHVDRTLARYDAGMAQRHRAALLHRRERVHSRAVRDA